MQTGFGDSEILGDLLDRGVALAGDRDNIAAELLRIRLRHGGHPSSEDEVLTDQESTKPGAVPNIAMMGWQDATNMLAAFCHYRHHSRCLISIYALHVTDIRDIPPFPFPYHERRISHPRSAVIESSSQLGGRLLNHRSVQVDRFLSLRLDCMVDESRYSEAGPLSSLISLPVVW
ncbi:hypothetical protein [Nocardia sp. NPDC004860]|uniref:hypothetical protein n=1 Tax=Nocardia sp. NPDC004860 TaxID=3154557 RepID=UPI0033AF3175